ncbi:serine/threonine-protein kinase [Streptomyces cellulosae]|uniref:serine/threonine-protein kinase n=1 Tax=Streptomyces cellulosae TaxID=1968 RepID=UPI0004CA6892|nr:serine/threonine-protein kinase [Streptomyces cellulosae]
MSYGGDDTDPRNALLGGRYRLIERIGSGGMGTVWRARDELVEREVAVKQPRLPGDPEDEEHRRAAHRLYREARAAARVDHPAAVSIHDVVVEEADGLPWIVMELIHGESLYERLRRGPLPPAEAARIALAVLGALRAAHAVGIVHRDVKPANVLLGPRHRVVLTDFGIAHVQGEESLTATGEFIGSLEFVAPERMSGTGAGPASDLWSLGVLLHTAVEGASPFRRTTPEATLAAIVTADPPEPKQSGPLQSLITRMLAKDPERRPDAEEIARVLESVAGEDPRPGSETRDAVEEAQEPAVREPGAEAPAVREPGAEAPAVREPSVEEPVVPAPAVEESAVTKPAVTEPAVVDEPLPQRPHPPSPRRSLLRTGVAVIAVLLPGGIWLGTSFADGTAAQDGWVVHREDGMGAALRLPRAYRPLDSVGERGDATRLAVYSDEVISVYLSEWEKAPRSPMAEAGRTPIAWQGHESLPGQYTRTSFHGDEAALADVTYDPDGRPPTRVMQLIVRTDDDRLYQLRVDMPKGTPDEKRGTALFKGARARLKIGTD